MSSELELTVTITYEGAKARITTAEEAVPAIRQDLTALGIPHPKRANVSVVYPGTVRFFWIARRYSVIHKNLIAGIRPTTDLDEHRELLNGLAIRQINLREAPAPPELASPPNYNNHSGPTWKPDAGLFAVPMNALQQESNQSQPGDAVQLSDRLNSYPRRPYDAAASGSNSWSLRIKAEPVSDVPIPPQVSRTRYDDEMQIDSPRRSSASRRPLIRNRYAHLVQGSPQPPQDPEIQALQRELRDVRRQLHADIAQERAIVENLHELGAEDLSDASEVDFVTRARIEQFEAELQAERARRRRLEEIVEDIRRECREPFVVPSLLDAFIEISKLTNEALSPEEG